MRRGPIGRGSLSFILLFGVIFAFPKLAWSAFRLGKSGPWIRGFIEGSYGKKLHEDQTKHDEYDLCEVHFQLKTRMDIDFNDLLYEWGTQLNVKVEGLLDEYFDTTVESYVRELNLVFTPVDRMDVKVGRQILTWGTGDYLFVNDLFPKDYVSFYVGRDDEYLKKPSDAVRVSIFFPKASLDLVWIPEFIPNTMPVGERLSFWDPYFQRIAGRDSVMTIIDRSRKIGNSEYAGRLYGNIGSYEWALYYFNGFYKNPAGFADQTQYQVYYPNLNAYGFSFRGPVVGGIGNVEFGYYDSREDPDGRIREVPNSKWIVLLGYERDMGHDFRIAWQWQYEYMLDYNEYLNSLLPSDIPSDVDKTTLTLRLTKQLWKQTLTLSLFVFWSPDEEDAYWRPSVSYDISDDWNITFGANFIWGKDNWTDFGQMERNSNVYVRLRYSF